MGMLQIVSEMVSKGAMRENVNSQHSWSVAADTQHENAKGRSCKIFDVVVAFLPGVWDGKRGQRKKNKPGRLSLAVLSRQCLASHVSGRQPRGLMHGIQPCQQDPPNLKTALCFKWHDRRPTRRMPAQPSLPLPNPQHAGTGLVRSNGASKDSDVNLGGINNAMGLCGFSSDRGSLAFVNRNLVEV